MFVPYSALSCLVLIIILHKEKLEEEEYESFLWCEIVFHYMVGGMVYLSISYPQL